jgi:hypothetical protein
MFNLYTEVDERLASRSGRYIHEEIALGTLWIGYWLGNRATLKSVEKGKMSALDTNRTPARNLIVVPTKVS